MPLKKPNRWVSEWCPLITEWEVIERGFGGCARARGRFWRVSPGRVPPSKATLSSVLHLKVALDGGTRPGDTLQILPLALAQPPNPRSITSHSVLGGHPALTHRDGFFNGIQWVIHSQKIIIGTAFFSENKAMHFRWNINLFNSLGMCNYYM